MSVPDLDAAPWCSANPAPQPSPASSAWPLGKDQPKHKSNAELQAWEAPKAPIHEIYPSWQVLQEHLPAQ